MIIISDWQELDEVVMANMSYKEPGQIVTELLI